MSLPPANWDCFIDDACVLCLLFEEGEGDTAHDLTRFRNDGTIYGPTWVGTPYGRGLEFDGVDDHVIVPSTPVLALGDEMSWEFIFKFTENGLRQGLLVKGVWSVDNSDYALPFRTDRRLRLWLSDGTTGEERDSNSALSPDRWYHVCVVFRRSDLSVEFWINGELDSSKTFTINPQSITDFVDICRTGGWFFNGSMSLVRIYNRALTPEEIRALYQNYRYGLACYKLIGQVINPLISDTYERVELIRKIQTNRWKIEDNQLIIFDDDGVTPLKIFNLKDKYGNPSEVNVYEREPV